MFASQSICRVWYRRSRVWRLYCVVLRGLLCNLDFTGGGSLFWLHRGCLSILTLSPLSLLTTPIPQDCIDSDEDDGLAITYKYVVLKKIMTKAEYSVGWVDFFFQFQCLYQSRRKTIVPKRSPKYSHGRPMMRWFLDLRLKSGFKNANGGSQRFDQPPAIRSFEDILEILKKTYG